MSLLKVCAWAKRVGRRGLLDTCKVRGTIADHCQLCASTRSGGLRRWSETRQQLQWRNVVPKTQSLKKRSLEQSQLLDVLEARIQQLQTDIALNIQHAEVRDVKAPSVRRGGGGASSAAGPKSASKEKPAVSKWRMKTPAKPPQSLQTETSAQETKVKSQQDTSVHTAKSKVTQSGSLRLPSASHKTISSAAKKTAAKTGNAKSGEHTKADSASAAAADPQVTKKKRKTKQKPDEEFTADELAKVKELQGRLSQHEVHSGPELPLVDSEWSAQGEATSRISSYLEACLFIGDIERANSFLLGQHRKLSRRQYLNTSVYNIMMRMWAKKASLNHITRIFFMLEEANLKPDLVSYAAALECMGRKETCSESVVQRLLTRMEKDGLALDDIFLQCVFTRDEKEMVLEAVRKLRPEYQPPPDPTTGPVSYPSLVQDFYAKRSEHRYPKLNLTQKELQERFLRQLEVEQACTITIQSVEAAKPATEHIARMRTVMAEQRVHWKKILLQALRDNKNLLNKTSKKSEKPNLYPYLCLLDDSEYVNIMIESVTNMPPSGESLKILAADLGNSVLTKFTVRQRKENETMEKLTNIYNSYTELLASDTQETPILPREFWCHLEQLQEPGAKLQSGLMTWPYMLTLKLGVWLVELMVKNLKVNSDILRPSPDRKWLPILYHMYTFRSTKQVGFIKPHPLLIKLQQEAMEVELTFDSSVMPMLCPPVPWTSVKFGAYLLTPVKLMRSVDNAAQHEVLLDQCQNLDPVLDSLNQLGACAWRINQPLLDIIVSIFNHKGSEKLSIPPPLSEAPKVPHIKTQDPKVTPAEKSLLAREAVKARKKWAEMHSLRMDALYKLSIAQHMRDQIFWFPHNMDFRGRTYPCPPHLNHLGSDVTRAILVFAEGKPLGPRGLDWLKIHLVNLTGLKKRSSLQGRLEYADAIMEDILDSADNPLNGRKWWMDADEPWQALACCMEVARAVRSPDPTKFISSFPVHQDGSCNGLQHYAALGRDVIGATSVNLMPSDVPQDVYSGVAQQVEDLRARDAADDLKVAKVLEGFISRKVVKQTVMTVVYGVTRYGGRLQIEKRLKEIDDFPKEDVRDASYYLVKLVFSGLNEMFTGTREIQDWLTDSARLISKSGHTVEWVTPLGLPVIQPYHRPLRHTVKSTMQNVSVQISHDTKERPNTVKQKNAFPPNFIHSLDSTHMMLTSLHCHSAGLTFVSVHDCFWTHAVTVDIMNKVCREQFVALHSEPILQDLSNFLLLKYCAQPPTEVKNAKYREYRKLLLMLGRVPQTGDFDLQRVKESTYFFS